MAVKQALWGDPPPRNLYAHLNDPGLNGEGLDGRIGTLRLHVQVIAFQHKTSFGHSKMADSCRTDDRSTISLFGVG